jgi:hypothetical protein
MNYYRVKPECDQKQRIKYHRYTIKQKPDGVFVANELYTAGEIEKFYIPFDKFYDVVDHVVIPKNKVCWINGRRFEIPTYTQQKGL